MPKQTFKPKKRLTRESELKNVLRIEAIQIKAFYSETSDLTWFLDERIHLQMISSRDDATLMTYLEVMHSGTRDSSSCLKYRRFFVFSYPTQIFSVHEQ